MGGGVKNWGTVYSLNLGLAKPAPATRMYSPDSGPTGTSILIHGRYFVGVTEVTVGGAQAAVNVASAEWMRVTVPANAVSGPIVITTPGGSVTAGQFKVLPTVSALSPSSGDVGQTVVISGSGFSGVHSVSFNGAAATFTLDSPTQISATVPAGASTGPITLSTSDASAASGTFLFTGHVQATPTATAVSATPVPTGTTVSQPTVSITGSALYHTVRGKNTATSLLYSGEKGTFSVSVSVQNAGAAQPSVTVQFQKAGKAVGAPISMRKSGSGYTATKSFKTRNQQYDALTATFTAGVGSARARSTLSFRVTTNKHLHG
jgi:hypothetical protein